MTPPRPRTPGRLPALPQPPPGPWQRLREALLDAAAVLFPVECAGCGSPDRSVCVDCARAMTARVAVHRTSGALPVYSALDYGGVVRASILALKENGRTDAARFLAPALATAVAAARGPAADAPAGLAPAPHGAAQRARTSVQGDVLEVVTVPPSRSAWRRRGYDPVRLLGRRVRPRPVRVLVIRRPPRRQKTLSVEERATNMNGTMRARRRLDGRRFVIVDDVMTTGSTLSEAARAIEAAGGTVVAGACLAFTALRGDQPRRAG